MPDNLKILKFFDIVLRNLLIKTFTQKEKQIRLIFQT